MQPVICMPSERQSGAYLIKTQPNRVPQYRFEALVSKISPHALLSCPGQKTFYLLFISHRFFAYCKYASCRASAQP